MPIKGSLLRKGSEGGCYERGKKGHDKVKNKNNTNGNSRSYSTCKTLAYLAQNTCGADSVYTLQQ